MGPVYLRYPQGDGDGSEHRREIVEGSISFNIAVSIALGGNPRAAS
jgi:hypothetical protein